MNSAGAWRDYLPMPFTFLSHQAAVLPLKCAAPWLFCGTALVIGSMAPDLEYFLYGRPHRTIGHEVLGQFTFCLPLTLLLVWLVTRHLARPLALHVPDCGGFRLRDYRLLRERSRSPGYWRAAVRSALVGSFSHLAWDSFTHESGWSVGALGYRSLVAFTVLGNELRLYKVLQHGSTLAGAAITVWLLYRIGSRRCLRRWAGEVPDEPLRPTAASHRALWGLTLAGIACGAALGLIIDGSPFLPFHPVAPELIAFKAVSCGFAGLTLGCIAAERLMCPLPHRQPSLQESERGRAQENALT